jgi:hypothetical protein
MALVLLRFLWNARNWPFPNRRELFFLRKGSLTLQFEPRSTVLLLTVLHHLTEGKKNKIKCGVQVKYSRDFVWLRSHAFSHLYIGINYVSQLVPLALLWMKTWPTNLESNSCWANEEMQHAPEAHDFFLLEGAEWREFCFIVFGRGGVVCSEFFLFY